MNSTHLVDFCLTIEMAKELRMSINQLNALFGYFMQFYAYFSHFCPLKN